MISVDFITYRLVMILKNVPILNLNIMKIQIILINLRKRKGDFKIMTYHICQNKEYDRKITVDYCNNVCEKRGKECKNLYYLIPVSDN